MVWGTNSLNLPTTPCQVPLGDLRNFQKFLKSPVVVSNGKLCFRQPAVPVHARGTQIAGSFEHSLALLRMFPCKLQPQLSEKPIAINKIAFSFSFWFSLSVSLCVQSKRNRRKQHALAHMLALSRPSKPRPSVCGLSESSRRRRSVHTQAQSERGRAALEFRFANVLFDTASSLTLANPNVRERRPEATTVLYRRSRGAETS